MFLLWHLASTRHIGIGVQVAKDAGIYGLSEVSSFPVLTAAVLREIAKEFPITDVTGGIALPPTPGIGLNVMRADVGYARPCEIDTQWPANRRTRPD